MVTWHALGFASLTIIGIVMAGVGLLFAFGSGMSDSPSAENARDGKRGCGATLLGIVLIGVSIWQLIA